VLIYISVGIVDKCLDETKKGLLTKSEKMEDWKAKQCKCPKNIDKPFFIFERNLKYKKLLFYVSLLSTSLRSLANFGIPKI